jgi:hypothetical protein
MPRNCFAIKHIADGHLQLVHRASGTTIQRHNCDFTRVSDAARVRDAMLAAASNWDWSDPGLFEEMPAELFRTVWAAIYAA